MADKLLVKIYIYIYIYIYIGGGTLASTAYIKDLPALACISPARFCLICFVEQMISAVFSFLPGVVGNFTLNAL